MDTLKCHFWQFVALCTATNYGKYVTWSFIECSRDDMEVSIALVLLSESRQDCSIGFRIIAETKLCDKQTFMLLICFVQQDNLLKRTPRLWSLKLKCKLTLGDKVTPRLHDVIYLSQQGCKVSFSFLSAAAFL